MKITAKSNIKKGVKIPLNIKIISLLNNYSAQIKPILERLIVVTYWLGIYAILSYFLRSSGWHIFMVSVAIYFFYEKILLDIIKIKLLEGHKK